jgi:hypothetical protein
LTDLVRPEDILPDGVDNTTINGKMIRKGTIAAFLANADILENKNTTKQQRQEAINMMKQLAPAVVSIGLHKHVVFKNNLVEQILVDAE